MKKSYLGIIPYVLLVTALTVIVATIIWGWHKVASVLTIVLGIILGSILIYLFFRFGLHKKISFKKKSPSKDDDKKDAKKKSGKTSWLTSLVVSVLVIIGIWYLAKEYAFPAIGHWWRGETAILHTGENNLKAGIEYTFTRECATYYTFDTEGGSVAVMTLVYKDNSNKYVSQKISHANFSVVAGADPVLPGKYKVTVDRDIIVTVIANHN